MELAFLCLGVQLVLQETFQDCSDVTDMFFIGFRVNQDVVDVDDYPLVQLVERSVVNTEAETTILLDKEEPC